MGNLIRTLNIEAYEKNKSFGSIVNLDKNLML